MSAETEADPFVTAGPPLLRNTVAFKIVCGLAIGLGMCAAFARTARGKALLVCMALATPAASMSTQPTTVHSSVYAKSSFAAFDVEGRSTSFVARSRQHGIMDTGTTECTSGRRKLFPPELVAQYDPPIKVEIASGVLLPVKLCGGMVMQVQRTGTTSTKKRFTLIVNNSFYVPQMPVTLVSTKALCWTTGVTHYRAPCGTR